MRKIFNIRNLLLFILGMQIITIVIVNLTFRDRIVDNDMAKLYIHALEMVRNGSYIIPDWNYITTMELDCSLLFAVPLIAISKDVFLSFGISNIIFIMIFVWTIFRLFKQMHCRLESTLLALILLFIPYAIGSVDYFNMLFFNGSQYIIKVLIPLMLLSIVIYDMEEIKEKIKLVDVLFRGLSIFFVFVSSLSSGVYILVCGIAPIAIVLIIKIIFQKFIPNKRGMIYVALIGVAAGFGLILSNVLGIGAKGNSMMLCPINELQKNIFDCFTGLFELFGGVTYSPIQVISLNGVVILLKAFFVVILYINLIVTICKVIKKKSDAWEAVLVSLFVFNYCVLSVCATHYGGGYSEYRYHIIGGICLIILLAKNLDGIWEQNNVRVVLCTLLFVGVIGVASFYKLMKYEDGNKELKELCMYINGHGYDSAYFVESSGDGEIALLLDDNTKYRNVTWSGGVFMYDYYKSVFDEQIEPTNSAVVINTYWWDIGDVEELVIGTQCFTKNDEVGRYHIYSKRKG